MEKATKKFKNKARVFKALGYTTTAIGTLGGFFSFQMFTDWSYFQTQLENFIVVNQESVKLNLGLALPILLSMIVFISITMRKNREFFKDKVSLSLLLTIVVFYLIYSVIEMTLATLTGAFLGSIVDEFVFTPIASLNQEKFLESKDIDVEYDKETRRIKARQKAKEDLDGSV